MVGQASEIVLCPHRATRWELSVLRHAGRKWGSGLTGPPQLVQSTAWHFTQEAQRELMYWMDQAKIAINARWASVREDYTKARRYNLQNLRQKLMKKGFLDFRTLHTAFGIRQPKRRMFAITGKVATGVRLGTEGQMEAVLDVLTKLQVVEAVVQLLGTAYGLQAWFKGPQPLGNFLAAWCGYEHTHDFDIAMLYPQSTFVAITPDDICWQCKNFTWPRRAWTQHRYALPVKAEKFNPSPLLQSASNTEIRIGRYASYVPGVGE
jgi:hypothetical protein